MRRGGHPRSERAWTTTAIAADLAGQATIGDATDGIEGGRRSRGNYCDLFRDINTLKTAEGGCGAVENGGHELLEGFCVFRTWNAVGVSVMVRRRLW